MCRAGLPVAAAANRGNGTCGANKRTRRSGKMKTLALVGFLLDEVLFGLWTGVGGGCYLCGLASLAACAQLVETVGPWAQVCALVKTALVAHLSGL